MTARDRGSDALRDLLTPEAVRRRAHRMLDIGLTGDLPHFIVVPARLEDAVALVLRETRAAYPDLKVPPHSRWRHFELDGRDFWREIQATVPALSGDERARSRFDLAVISVLLDAGAGDRWRFRDGPGGQSYARSEGLAVASLRLFAAGGFSSDDGKPLRADAAGLAAIDAAALGRAFQTDADNPLTGLASRADLLNRLGKALRDHAGDTARPALLFDGLRRRAKSCWPCSTCATASGRTASRSTGWRWAMSAGIRHWRATMPPPD